MQQEKILITGANGQIGSVLTEALRQLHGAEAIIASDIRAESTPSNGPFILLDILDLEGLKAAVQSHHITQIYHLAAILSAKGEQQPQRTWDINMRGLFNVLEVARTQSIQKLFFPSSIAVFGHNTPKAQTPQFAHCDPNTVYGISKLAGEQWCQYYWQRYQLDIRSLRYPGIISYQSLPGGGTTDYAVDIFHYAIRQERYSCFLAADTRLPMIYMPDAIRATIQLMAAPAAQIQVRTSYNLASMNFTPAEIYQAIRKYLPDFEIEYQPDFRQQIADSWSQSLDDQQAVSDWKWKAQYDLDAMTRDMLQKLTQQQGLTNPVLR